MQLVENNFVKINDAAPDPRPAEPTYFQRSNLSDTKIGKSIDLAAELEIFMGHPLDPESLFYIPLLMALDEREEFPTRQCNALNTWGLQRHYVPVALGGEQKSFEQTFSLVRAVARRDMTVAIAHAKTYLGVMGIWVAGNQAQKLEMAKVVLAGAAVSLALTERDHGSDLLHGEVSIQNNADVLELSGEKWLVNNATRSQALTVLARTRPEGGPRGFALVAVYKALLPSKSFSYLPKVRTLGVRGADISGISFHAAPLSPNAMIGGPSAGLEVILKSLQISRSMCASLSMGVFDTSFRCVFRFVTERTLYGKQVINLPHARRILGRAFIKLIICDCLSITAARALHVLSAQMSVISSVVKYFVPGQTDAAIDNLAVAFGARHYLREEYDHGIFQKMMRDSRLVFLFDGSGPVNLHSIAQQLPLIARKTMLFDASKNIEIFERLRTLFDLSAEVPSFQPELLSMSSHGRDDILCGMAWLVSELNNLAQRESADEACVMIAKYADLLRDRIRLMLDELAQPATPSEGRLFLMAEDYCAFYASAVALYVWYYNRGNLGAHFSDGWWLVLHLAELLNEKCFLQKEVDAKGIESGIDWATVLISEGRSLSIVPSQKII
jgi:alkylation response protein AidB-like acyl-CoA dehydrogenase